MYHLQIMFIMFEQVNLISKCECDFAVRLVPYTAYV
jgi:hypothetical protein